MMAYKVIFVRDLPEWLTLIRQVVLKNLFCEIVALVVAKGVLDQSVGAIIKIVPPVAHNIHHQTYYYFLNLKY